MMKRMGALMPGGGKVGGKGKAGKNKVGKRQAMRQMQDMLGGGQFPGLGGPGGAPGMFPGGPGEGGFPFK
jgi:hypothetical protein